LGGLVGRWTERMDFEFTPDEEAFRAELRAFLDEELPEWWRTVFVDDARALSQARGARLVDAQLAEGARRGRRLGLAAGGRPRGDVGRRRTARAAVHEPQLHRPAHHALRHPRAAGAVPP